MEQPIVIIHQQSDESFARKLFQLLQAANIRMLSLFSNKQEILNNLPNSRLCFLILSQKYMMSEEIVEYQKILSKQKIPFMVINIGVKDTKEIKRIFSDVYIFDAISSNEDKGITSIRQFLLNESLIISKIKAWQEKVNDLEEELSGEKKEARKKTIRINIDKTKLAIDNLASILKNVDAVRIFKLSDLEIGGREDIETTGAKNVNHSETSSVDSRRDFPSYSKQRLYYLHDLIDKVSQLPLSRITTDQIEPIYLSGVYIDLPTNANLHLNIHEYQITDWFVNSKTTVENDFFAFDSVSHEEYNIEAIQDIVLEAQEFIVGKGGRISPKEKNRPLIYPPLWEDGVIRNYYNLATFDVAAATNRLVLTGVPGSGKSTFVKYLALYLAKMQLQRIDNEVDNEIYKHRWLHDPFTPILIEIRRFVDWKGFPDIDSEVTIDHFWEYICEELLRLNKEFKDDLWDDLISGNALIILDGLDEAKAPIDIADGQKKRFFQIAHLVRKINNRFPACRLIITSRPNEFESIKSEIRKQKYNIISIEPLNVELMSTLAYNLYRSIGIPEEDADKKTRLITEELTPVYDYLKNRPLFLTLMVFLSLNSTDQRLPATRGALLHQSIFLLVDRWTRGRLSDESNRRLKESDTKEIYRCLENIAYRAQGRVSDDKYHTVDIDIGEIYREFQSYRTRMFEIVEYLTAQAGLFDRVKQDTYKFSHRTFQEFLAASYLVRKGDFAEVRNLIQSQLYSWRESCNLVGDLISEKDERGLWNLIDTLIDFEVPDSNLTDIRYWSPVWLCSNIVIAHRDYLVRTKNRYSYLVNSLRSRITALLSMPKVLLPADRVCCGSALGYLGDNRFGVGTTNGIPEIDWCHVPSGNFQMGLTDEQVAALKKTTWAGDWEFTDEIPFGNIEVREFSISRFPVTIIQYQAFMNAKDGYWNNCWWTKTGLAIRDKLQAPYYEESSIIPLNFPQTEVTWFAAMAFCNWLSEKLGCKISLPTEAEWERAARGTDGRFFPWGNDYDPQLSNIAETGIKCPSPVGCFAFPNGPSAKDTPLDMCGNVWEWCTSAFQIDKQAPFPNPYNSNDGREDIELGSDCLRIVRGGSYTNIPYLTRVTVRGRDNPSLKHARQGFRVVKYVE